MAVLLRAINADATDIHIEPIEGGARVRLRSSGILRKVAEIDRKAYRTLLEQIWARIGKSPERMRTLDGAFLAEVMGRKAEFRISAVPTIWGHRVVMRIFREKERLLRLENLGFSETQLREVEAIIRGRGLLLVVGPVNSGKSTTLHAIAEKLSRDEEISVLTIEDPIEYRLTMASQIEVNEKLGLSFHEALRGAVRQDPDVLLIGEIRDRESADVAIQASLTGHLVLASLHVDRAYMVPLRMERLGIDRKALAEALVGIITQRLLRRLCNRCKVQGEGNPEEAKCLGASKHWVPSGCERCDMSGFSGRRGLFEVLRVTESIREAFARGSMATLKEVEESLEESLERVARRLVEEGEVTARDAWRSVAR